MSNKTRTFRDPSKNRQDFWLSRERSVCLDATMVAILSVSSSFSMRLRGATKATNLLFGKQREAEYEPLHHVRP